MSRYTGGSAGGVPVGRAQELEAALVISNRELQRARERAEFLDQRVVDLEECADQHTQMLQVGLHGGGEHGLSVSLPLSCPLVRNGIADLSMSRKLSTLVSGQHWIL